MRCEWTSDGRVFELTVRPDPDEALVGGGQAVRRGQERMVVELVTNRCRVGLPMRIGDPHPDLLAVAAYCVTKPWIGRRLEMNRQISSRLAEAFAAIGIDAGPVAPGETHRPPSERIALSYSGGMDAIAASVLLPDESPFIHLQRIAHRWVPDRTTHVKSAAIASAATGARRAGHDVHIVQTDLEFLCLPFPTFPEWQAVGIGAVLLADHLDLGSIAFGSILEAVYLDNGHGYLPRDNRDHVLFAAAGVATMEPVAGLTEVGTRLLAAKSELFGLARSCLLAESGPCLSCVKCLRKELLHAAVEGSELPPQLLAAAAAGSAGIERYSGEPPYFMNDVMSWAVDRLDLADTALQAMKINLLAAADPPSWVDELYLPAVSELVPEPHREPLRAELLTHFDPMSPDEERDLESFVSGTSPATAPR